MYIRERYRTLCGELQALSSLVLPVPGGGEQPAGAAPDRVHAPLSLITDVLVGIAHWMWAREAPNLPSPYAVDEHS
jgi:hypothetical protein